MLRKLRESNTISSEFNNNLLEIKEGGKNMIDELKFMMGDDDDDWDDDEDDDDEDDDDFDDEE